MSGLGAAGLRARLEEWAERPDTWQPLVEHDPAERTYALVHRDEEVEVYLVCWMLGHDTGFHDHDHSAAAITVLDGAVTEQRLSLSGAVEVTLHAGDTIAIGPEAIHRVRHVGSAPAISLHAYSPPLDRVGTYEVAGDGTLLRHPRAAEARLEPVA